jgi:alcohol dehydrogenase class IV
MALAALLSGIALTNAGLGAVHGFAAPLGANFPVPHGTVCGVLLPHVIEANRAALQAAPGSGRTLEKYATIDRAMGGDAATRCRELVTGLKLSSLGSFGITERDIVPMVDLAKRASSMRYNPVTLDDRSLSNILAAAI